MSYLARLRTLEAAVWAAGCHRMQQIPEADLPTFEEAYGGAAAQWLDAYLDGLSEQEQAVLADPDNWTRYPPHPVSQRLLTAWHAFLAATK